MSVLLETDENFANAIFYVIKDNVTNKISGDLAIQLGLLTLHNKRYLKSIHKLFLQLTFIYVMTVRIKLQKNFEINITRYLKVYANIPSPSIYQREVHQWLKKVGTLLIK